MPLGVPRPDNWAPTTDIARTCAPKNLLRYIKNRRRRSGESPRSSHRRTMTSSPKRLADRAGSKTTRPHGIPRNF